MKSVSHKITISEIKWGILNMTIRDGTKSLFDDLPERFSINFREHIIRNRKIVAKKVWIGYEESKKFQPNEIIKLVREENVIHIE